MKNLIFCCAVIVSLMMGSSCKKEATKPELLTHSKWKLSGYDFIPGITIAGYYYTDYYGPYVSSDCIYDQIISFTEDGRIVSTEGGIVCNDGTENFDEGSWYFNDDESYLYVNAPYHSNIFHYSITANELTVVELDKEHMVLEGVYARDSSIRYRFTFEAQ